jgi:hypothetical protein
MKRTELEHVIRAAGEIAGDRELIIVGSQAILGQYPDAPPELRMSMEVDLWPKNNPELADKVDGSIGEGSQFHEEFGYYAQGVGPGTANLPRGWEERLIKVQNENTRRITGWCLEAHDLALSKYAAGRDKDLAYTRVMVRQKMLDRKLLLKRLPSMAVDGRLKELIEGRIARQFDEAKA